jgi:hypothetical protein
MEAWNPRWAMVAARFVVTAMLVVMAALPAV